MVKITPKRIILSAVIAVLIAVAIIASAFAAAYWDYLMGAFGASNFNTDEETVSNALSLGDDLVQEIAEDSMVLLKNENETLPLAEDNRKINLFGYGATANGWVYSGGGSSGTIINIDRASDEDLERITVSPQEAFEQEGFEVNADLMKVYTDFSDYKATSERGITSLYQPVASEVYTHALLADAIAFSDTAVVVISRTGSESTEIPLVQYKNNGRSVTDSERTYLQLTEEEEDMLEIVTDNFETVIVLLNTMSQIEAGFLDDEGIDAALYVGPTGQSGTLAIPRLLKGYKTVTDEDGNESRVAVTPSGRLADTYAYSTREYNPTDVNMFAHPSTDGDITYAEGIYVGYKWYETAYAEGYFDDVTTEYGKGYDGVVQYPFGYGLSYGTDFAYTVTSDLEPGSDITADTKIKISVTVTNRGETATVPGKDVVQLYYSSEYHEGEIEKSAVNLLAFGKTQMLDPGQAQTIEFEITPYDLASYDAYGKNPGDHTGYELDRGTLTISLRTDAHTLADCENASMTFNVPETINIDNDPVTNEPVKNRFTGDDAYMGVPIDASTLTENGVTEYLSRADIAGTFPDAAGPEHWTEAAAREINTKRNTRYDVDNMPTTGTDSDLRLVLKEDGTPASLEDLQGNTGAKLAYNEELVLRLGSNYKDDDWKKLVEQMTAGELRDLVANGYFGTHAVASVGKPQRLDVDGPAGFHYTGSNVEDRDMWIAYPSQCLIGCSWNQQTAFNMGQAQGVLANATGISGWYGPGLNLHRNPYSGRHFEYYSEDPILVGKLAAEVIRGATNNGLYCYMKHFAVSEEGINPDNVMTWLSEQTLRETYLKPFEIAVKEGGANAVMTSFNCIGAVWAGACDPMNNDILRGEWGFRGSLITDWSLGRDWMNGELGIRGGNDLWLDLGEPFDTSDPTTVSLLQTAAKNILYTFASTYYRADDWQKNGDKDDRYTVDLGLEVTAAPFSPVPILMVVGIWLLAAAGSAVCVVFIVRSPSAEKER